TLNHVSGERPIYLVVDELQWLPELTTELSQSTETWQSRWIAFIERHCALDGVALGTAHGTLALYHCTLEGQPPPGHGDRIVGGSLVYQRGERVWSQDADSLAAWPRYEDPRRTAASTPEVRRSDDGLRISGSGWPGIVSAFHASAGERYLVRTSTA